MQVKLGHHRGGILKRLAIIAPYVGALDSGPLVKPQGDKSGIHLRIHQQGRESGLSYAIILQLHRWAIGGAETSQGKYQGIFIQKIVHVGLFHVEIAVSGGEPPHVHIRPYSTKHLFRGGIPPHLKGGEPTVKDDIVGYIRLQVQSESGGPVVIRTGGFTGLLVLHLKKVVPEAYFSAEFDPV